MCSVRGVEMWLLRRKMRLYLKLFFFVVVVVAPCNKGYVTLGPMCKFDDYFGNRSELLGFAK